MALNVLSYFGGSQNDLESIIDFVISQEMHDGGFNCRLNRNAVSHSSMHTTISVLEGISEYLKSGYKYRSAELKRARNEAEEFLLRRSLFRSEHTSEIIDKKYLQMHYPVRWRYDVLRALDYFACNGRSYDPRMQEAIDILEEKKNDEGKWPLNTGYPGEIHFQMEKAGKPSRWNTLRMLRIKKFLNS